MPDFSFALTPHPAHGPGPLHAVAAAGSVRDGCLDVTFVMRGRVAEVDLPAYSKRPCRKDELWTQSCCEIFVALHDGYLELNFSPARDWAAYRFAGYRRGRSVLDGIAVDVDPWNRSADELRLHACARWPANLALEPEHWHINACVIVLDTAGQTSYWALRHPSEEPDFHHTDSLMALEKHVKYPHDNTA